MSIRWIRSLLKIGITDVSCMGVYNYSKATRKYIK